MMSQTPNNKTELPPTTATRRTQKPDFRLFVLLVLVASGCTSFDESLDTSTAALSESLEEDSDCDKDPEQPSATGPTRYVGADLSPDRGNALSPGTLQVTVFYDGDIEAQPTIEFFCENDDGEEYGLVVSGIVRSGQFSHERTITTAEYELGACRLTGEILVEGVVPDGVIDGVAIGVFLKDQDGLYCIDRTQSTTPSSRTAYVGLWPLGFGPETFNLQVPQITNGPGRSQARVSLMGAELVGNGHHQFHLCGL